jgi:hypothetical protein
MADPVADRAGSLGAFYFFRQEYSHMKISSKMTLRFLAIAGAIVMSAAYAEDYCSAPCTAAAQDAANQAANYYATQQSNYCGTLTDYSARSACYAGVPAYVQQQSQVVYNSVYNQCLSSCHNSHF